MSVVGELEGALTAEDCAALRELLDRVGLEPTEAFTINPWKRTATLGVRDVRQIQALLKWHSAASPECVHEWFGRERELYLSPWAPEIGPPLLQAGEDWILLSRVAGTSALDALLAGIHGERELASVSAALFTGLAGRYGPIIERASAKSGSLPDAQCRLCRTASSLASSGPMRFTSPRASRMVGRGMAFAARPLVRRALALAARDQPALLRRGWAHGDLHLDNIVLANDGRVFLVDFATWCGDGFPVLDLVYAAAAALCIAEGTGGESVVRRSLDVLTSSFGTLGATMIALAETLSIMGKANARSAPSAGRLRLARNRAAAPVRLLGAALRAAPST
jgi:hypothetical protein